MLEVFGRISYGDGQSIACCRRCPGEFLVSSMNLAALGNAGIPLRMYESF